VARTGDILSGLYYPIAIALMTFVIGMIFIKEKRNVSLES